MVRGPKCEFNVFERIESIKDILLPIIPDRDSFKLRGILMRCSKYQVKLIPRLDDTEAKAYDLLMQHKMKPKTVYEWFLLENVPSHIKEKLVQRKISMLNARIQYVGWKRMSGTRAGKDIMEEMQRIIGGVRWKSQEDTRPQY